MFIAMNAGKESIALALEEDDDRAVLTALLDRADVVLQSFRPGSLARLGFSYEDVTVRNPDVVYCSISGFGDCGPLSKPRGMIHSFRHTQISWQARGRWAARLSGWVRQLST